MEVPVKGHRLFLLGRLGLRFRCQIIACPMASKFNCFGNESGLGFEKVLVQSIEKTFLQMKIFFSGTVSNGYGSMTDDNEQCYFGFERALKQGAMSKETVEVSY